MRGIDSPGRPDKARIAPMLASKPLMTCFAPSMARARSCPDAPWTSSDKWGGPSGASVVREGPIEPRRPLPAPRLSGCAREAMRLRHFSARTEEAYLGPEHLTAFLNALATHRHVAASTQNQALAALLFLYRNVPGIRLPWLDDLVHAKTPAWTAHRA